MSGICFIIIQKGDKDKPKLTIFFEAGILSLLLSVFDNVHDKKERKEKKRKKRKMAK